MAEARAGHLNAARAEFDKAIDTYLTSPGGAFATAARAESYKRTLEAIHLWELEALAKADGFTETRPEPASIDEVAALVPDAPPSDDLRRTTEEAVRAEVNDFPVELNDAVLSCVDLYTGRLRDWFAGALSRGGRYIERIREVFASEGLPQDLAYLAMVESAFKPAALSRAKAKGVWQFMPGTGKEYGLKQDFWIDERSDPDKATVAAARYLKQLYGMFGDWNLAMAAYNAGPGKVQRGIQRYKVTDYWRLRQTRAFRRETKNYVPLIHAAIVVAKAPDKYGFEVAPEALPASETVSVEGAFDLRIVSDCAGAPLESIQLLNPALRRLATPAGRTYELRVPVGTAAAVQTCLDTLPPEKRLRFQTHRVARGQSLRSIASRYGVRSADLAAANAISTKTRLKPGTELLIPIDPTARQVASRAAKVTTPLNGMHAPKNGAVRISYRIKPGDTLGAIAEQYGTTIRDIQSWNGLRNTRIVAGTTLTIFTTRGF
jgi:membrane-bound lytic murein transglycosylase D